jgi:hypothetical protein
VRARVGNETITEEQLKRFIKNTSMTGVIVDEREALNELIIRSIIYQEAKKKGIDKRKAIKDRVEEFEHNLVLQTFMKEESLINDPLTDKSVRELYEKNWLDTRYPRWVMITLFRIRYEAPASETQALEYAKKIRAKINSDDFAEDPQAALRKLKEYLPPPEGITLEVSQNEKMFLLKIRAHKILIEHEALKLKKGETSEPLRSPQHPEYVLFNLTKEYPKEEVAFERVVSDLMMAGSRMKTQDQMKSFFETIKEDYKIEYFTE